MHVRRNLPLLVTFIALAACTKAEGGPGFGTDPDPSDDSGVAPDAAGDDVSFDRTQTLMQGAPCCTFRYKFEPR